MSFRSVTFSQKIPTGPFILLGLKRYLSRPRYLLFVGMISLFAGFAYFVGGPGRLDVMIPAGVLLLLMPGLHTLGLSYLVSSNLTLKDEHKVTADEKGILIEGNGFYSFLAWEVFTEIKNYQDWILLFVAKNSSIYLYLPEVKDLGDQEILRAMVNSEL